MDRIEIPNQATYSPIALSDLLLAAPLAARLLFRTSFPGMVIQAATFGAYAGSALRDWAARKDMRRVDFEAEFGGDVFNLRSTPSEVREAEVERLVHRLNEGYVEPTRSLDELAPEVNAHLTGFIAGLTGQVVETSSEVRRFSLAGLLMPMAYGACDIISGDIAIFKELGLLQAHVVTHEMVHRKGYLKELHAQALSYFALVSSGEPELVQSALAERLHRQLQTLCDDDGERFHERVDGLGLRPELEEAFHKLQPRLPTPQAGLAKAMRTLYDERMKITGQNGLSDYWTGFTDLLYTFAESPVARQDRGLAAV